MTDSCWLGAAAALLTLTVVTGLGMRPAGRSAGRRRDSGLQHREFDVPAEEAFGLGPEGVLFIPASDGPTGVPMVVVAHEVSGTIAITR